MEYVFQSGQGVPDPPKEEAKYWENFYRREREDVAENDIERSMFDYIYDGGSITGAAGVCVEKYGITIDEADEACERLRQRCIEWEQKH